MPPTTRLKRKREPVADSTKSLKRFAGSIQVHEENHEIINGDDQISELPIPVLCSIISFLPVKQAVATSAISRRWKDLWRYLNRLEFVECYTEEPGWKLGNKNPFRSYVGNVEKVLRSQRNSFVSFCRIFLADNFYRTRDFDEEKSWIEFLKNHRRLEHLVIIYGHKEVNPGWPPGFFNGRNLRVLELGHQLTEIQDASAFEGCKNLETLNLNSVILSDETLVDIVHNCTNLENLALIRCKGLSDVRIRDQSLKHLVIDDLRLESFKLQSESTRILSLVNFWCKSNDIDCPNLNVLRTKRNSSEILERLAGLVGSKDRVDMLSTVRTLQCTLKLENWYHLITLRFIFRAWTNLQQIYITNEVSTEDDHHSLPYPKVEFWAGESTDSIVCHLRVVQMRGFRGGEKEMLFVSHLIKTAEGLEKLEVQFDNATEKRVEEDAKRGLLSLSRASANASIVFNALNQKKKICKLANYYSENGILA